MRMVGTGNVATLRSGDRGDDMGFRGHGKILNWNAALACYRYVIPSKSSKPAPLPCPLDVSLFPLLHCKSNIVLTPGTACELPAVNSWRSALLSPRHCNSRQLHCNSRQNAFLGMQSLRWFPVARRYLAAAGRRPSAAPHATACRCFSQRLSCHFSRIRV